MTRSLLFRKEATYFGIILYVCLAATAGNVRAQNLNDGLMMPKNNFCTGFMYTHDQWKNYWEGELKRDNGNIGSITTQSLMWYANYGIFNRLDVIAMVPYVKTTASQGTLHGMEGVQDLTVGFKYNFVRIKKEAIRFDAFGVINGSVPLTNYTPDFFPLSIGTHTKNITYRLTAYSRLKQGWFLNASAGYTWRSNTKLDRTSYYNGNEFIASDQVKMPNVFDLFLSAGYHVGALQAQLQYTQMNTLGGGDIRRQDMPFVSNRMNTQRLGALVMYYLPRPRGFAVRGSVDYTLAGRNMGQATTLLAGLFYTIRFNQKDAQ
ncbi:MAG: transporter [Chryseolinea sp.]